MQSRTSAEEGQAALCSVSSHLWVLGAQVSLNPKGEVAPHVLVAIIQTRHGLANLTMPRIMLKFRKNKGFHIVLVLRAPSGQTVFIITHTTNDFQGSSSVFTVSKPSFKAPLSDAQARRKRQSTSLEASDLLMIEDVSNSQQRKQNFCKCLWVIAGDNEN